MKHRPSRPLDSRWGRPLLVALIVLGACATRGQVEAIVAESNAALVSPYVDVAGRPATDWQASVREIDQFIDAHSDNATLVNHLRVRQAMLLAANRKRNLADQYWDLVERDALDSERDRSLKDTGKQLSWWYQAAPNPARLDAAEAASARSALTAAVGSTTADTDVRIYLSTILAQLELRMGRDSQLEEPASELPQALSRYIEAIGADAGWIEAVDGFTPDDLASARGIRAFRYRIWLDELIRAYKRAATDLMLPEGQVDWKPDWVDPIR